MNWSTVCSGLCAERESRGRSQPQNRPRLDPGNSRQMHPRGLPTASYTYVTKMIDSTLTPRLNLACQCLKYAYAHPCLLSASIVLHLLLYLSFIILFRKIESPTETTSDLINYLQSDHITLAKPSTNLYISTSLKPPP